MSHHLDCPAARQDVRLDLTDLYVFRGETGTAFVFDACSSVAGPIPTPGFHPEGKYELHVDLDGDAIEDLTYRFTFDPRDAQGRQRYVVRAIRGTGDAKVLAEGQTDSTVTTASGVRVWAGQAGDPFWIEPDVLHAVGHALQDGTTVNLAGWDPARAKNAFAGHTVFSTVLEVPDKELLAGPRRRIGAWVIASLATDAGGWRSINRCALPMIHPLFTQFNEDLGNRLNLGRPADDFETHGGTIINAIGRVVAAYGTAQDARAYAERVARRFCPNILPYEVGTAATFGFAEWNGRCLTDNAPNVMFSIATNTPVSIGIGKESVTRKPSTKFPYVPALT